MGFSSLREDAAIPAGGTTAALMASRYRGALRVTVIAKATFSIARDATMPRARPQEIVRAEVHHGNTPTKSIRLTSDLVPYLKRADVLFTGSAYPPAGEPTEAMHVRLGIFDGARPVFHKALLVRQKGGFKQMPLVYERAFGGVGWLDNPFGVGTRAGADEPTVLDPSDPRRTAGFGPLSQAWPTRKRLLGALPRKALEGAIAEIPDDFDWDYFQAAPPDQRIPLLRGDEWIVMEGLHPSLPTARTRLPGARGVARIYGLSAHGIAEGMPLDLHADMLRIDGDEGRITVTWRGVFPVRGEAAFALVRVVVGVVIPGQPIEWPNVSAVLASRSEQAVGPDPTPRGAEGHSETLTLTEDDIASMRSPDASLDGTLVLDVGVLHDGAASGPTPGGASLDEPITAPVPLIVPKRAPAQQEMRPARTLPLEPPSNFGPIMPFRDGESPLAHASSPAPPREHALSGTLATAPDEEIRAAQRAVMPFHHGAASGPKPRAPAEPAPAAPGNAPSTPSPPPDVSPKREVTVSTAEPARPEPPPRAPKPPPAASPPTPSASLKKGLYGKFGGKR